MTNIETVLQDVAKEVKSITRRVSSLERVESGVGGGGGVGSFVELTDTPNGYSGSSGNVVTVNTNENGLEFSQSSNSGGSVSGAFLKTSTGGLVKVNSLSILSFTSAGVVKTSNAGVISSGLIANADIVSNARIAWSKIDKTGAVASDIGGNAIITAISSLTMTANNFIYFPTSGSALLSPITQAGRALLDDASVSDQRTTLGLGDAATKSVGTYSGTVAAGDHLHDHLIANSWLNNGGFKYAQRALDAESTGYIDPIDNYGADRWKFATHNNPNTDAFYYISTATNDDKYYITSPYYGVILKRGSSGGVMMSQFLEFSTTSSMLGKRVVFTVKMRASINTTVLMSIIKNTARADIIPLKYATGSNLSYASGLSDIYVPVVKNITTTWAEYYISVDIPSTGVNNIACVINIPNMGTNNYLYIAEAGLYVGSVPPMWYPRDEATELGTLKRYYEGGIARTPFSNIWLRNNITLTVPYLQKRINPNIFITSYKLKKPNHCTWFLQNDVQQEFDLARWNLSLTYITSERVMAVNYALDTTPRCGMIFKYRAYCDL